MALPTGGITTHSTGLAISKFLKLDVDSSPVNSGVRLLLKYMSEVKFPKREADGSFCIVITILVEVNEPERLSQQVQSWANQWVEENQIWTRKWSSGKEEQLYYSQEFKREPYPVSCSPTELKIRLECQPTAEWWKDWMVLRILNDLKSSFAEIRDVSSIKDCGWKMSPVSNAI